jgi:septum site-determining protein MinC
LHLPRHRALSSKAAKDYLAGFIGLPHQSQGSSPSNTSIHNPVMRARAAMIQGPLLLSGTSYLLPTLRLERHESPESLTRRLEQAAPTTQSEISNSNQSWCFPIVLDATALAPDGSPHYQPPPPGSLTRMIDILSTFGMRVIGITKLSSQQLAEEAAQAGIPSIWAPRRAGVDPKFDISQLLQALQQKLLPQHLPEAHRTDMEPAGQEENAAASSETQGKKKAEQSSVAGATPASSETKSLAEYSSRIPEKGSDLADEEGSRMASGLSSAMKSEEDHPAQANATSEQSAVADSSSSEDMADQTEIETQSATIPPIDFTSSSTLYHGSVRSGQQVLAAKGKSLVILGSVNSGGEVLSDGDIFVFGRLRGRAFAGLGITGADGMECTSSPARIVATSFDAELVAIGDTFTTIDRVEDLTSDKDTPLKAGQPVMVTLREGDADTISLKFSLVNM